MKKPSLTFFCELETPQLIQQFNGNKVLNYLSKLDANLSLGLLDLSQGRAEVVRKLNRAGIPVTAWLLLPKEQGYWTSLDTIDKTAVRYAEFIIWKNKFKLDFAAVGLDIEPDLRIMTALKRNPLSQAPNLLLNYISGSQYKCRELTARALIKKIKSDGFAVETYQFPSALDERAVNSNVLAKTLGIPPLPSDREVLMLYSSFFPAYADSILWSYARQCQAVGVGSTGGGVDFEGSAPLKILRWIDLKRDLLLANQTVKHIYIFSLEGCVNNNYLDRLVNLDWSTEVIPPHRSALGITLIRKVGQGLLWTLSHPLEVLLGLFIGARLLTYLQNLFEKKSQSRL